jgi:hypothetical protein
LSGDRNLHSRKSMPETPSTPRAPASPWKAAAAGAVLGGCFIPLLFVVLSAVTDNFRGHVSLPSAFLPVLAAGILIGAALGIITSMLRRKRN